METLTTIPPAPTAEPIGRDEAIARIRAGLRKRTGRAWSVTGGTGTAWGWIRIASPPAARTWRHRLAPGAPDRPESYEGFDSGEPGGHMTPTDCAALAEALGLERVHSQGESVPASSDYYREYVDRAEGRVPSKLGRPYWD